MKPEPEAVAVKVAHVPLVYHVPPEMMQPVGELEVVTWRVPRPVKGVPAGVVPVGAGAAVVVGGVGFEAVFGRYLMPVAGQLVLEPSVVMSLVSGDG